MQATTHPRWRRKWEHAILMAALLSAMFLAALRAESAGTVPRRHAGSMKSFLVEVQDTIVSKVSRGSVESFNFGARH